MILSCSMQGQKAFQEKLFTNFQLSDRVPLDNFYRRMKDLLDLNFLYKETAKYYGREGQESIDPVVFFKLILVGYFENLSSDRRIITTASMRLDILYFIGYNIDEVLPWHSTVSRTRQLYGEYVFKLLFRQVLKMCIDQSFVKGLYFSQSAATRRNPFDQINLRLYLSTYYYVFFDFLKLENS